MAKKKLIEEPIEETIPVIALIDEDLGREDLNLIARKINQIIRHLNAEVLGK